MSVSDRLRSNRHVVLAILTITYAINLMDRQLVPMLAQSIKIEFGLSDTQLGLLSGIVFALFYMSVAVPVAHLADRTNRTRVVAVACALWSGFTIMTGLATSTWQLVLARIGVGVGEAGGAAPSYSLIADYFPPERRSSAMAIFNLGFPAGIGVGIALAGTVAAEFGWRMAFFIAAIPGFVMAVLILLLREPRRGALDAPSAADGAGQPQPSLRASLKHYVGDPVLLRTTIATSLASFAFLGLLVWTPTFLMRVGGMSLRDVGMFFSVSNGIAMALGLFLGGVAADRLRRRTRRAFALVPAISLIATSPLLVVALMAEAWPVMLALLMVPTMLGLFYLGPATALIQNASPAPQRTVFSAIFLFCANVFGQGGGPFYVGYISDSLNEDYGTASLTIGMLALAPVYVAAGLAYLWAARAIPASRGADVQVG